MALGSTGAWEADVADRVQSRAPRARRPAVAVAPEPRDERQQALVGGAAGS